MSENIAYYSKHAESFADNYRRVSFESVRKTGYMRCQSWVWCLMWGRAQGVMRRYLAARGLNVVAVEPAQTPRSHAQQYTVIIAVMDSRQPYSI